MRRINLWRIWITKGGSNMACITAAKRLAVNIWGMRVKMFRAVYTAIEGVGIGNACTWVYTKMYFDSNRKSISRRNRCMKVLYYVQNFTKKNHCCQNHYYSAQGHNNVTVVFVNVTSKATRVTWNSWCVRINYITCLRHEEANKWGKFVSIFHLLDAVTLQFDITVLDGQHDSFTVTWSRYSGRHYNFP